MEPRRIIPPWDGARPPEPCTPVRLDAGSVLYLGLEQGITTLTRDAIYLANCPEGYLGRRDFTDSSDGFANDDSVSLDTGPGDLRDPFYASLFPVSYVLAATTVIAYMLVIMLFITQRTFVNGGIIYLGRRNRFTNGSTGTVDVGRRPWLQKVAALTVAISLTVATGATFKVASSQYRWGIQDARQLQSDVMDSTALKTIRLISDLFLWLAQAQTLIRLFQRHRQRVIIKWVALALITLDLIFSALNSFQYTNSGSQGNQRPRTFVEAIPALSYLFQLLLGVLYAAWVIYYSITKKRYAFYHPLMKNMPLVAIISLFSILIPIVFFILDISKPEVAGWGDYVRWVGAAAASVVVWEWVERIEALEREEKKDGILGRQVFDGEDMVEVTASSDRSWSRFRKDDSDGGGGNVTVDESLWGGAFSSGRGSIRASLAHRYRMGGVPGNGSVDETGDRGNLEPLRPPLWPAQPGTDAGSAEESTVYTVRYQNQSESTGRTPDPGGNRMASLSRENSFELDVPTPRAGDEARQSQTTARAPAHTPFDGEYARDSDDTEANTREMGPFFRRDSQQEQEREQDQPQPPPAAVLPGDARPRPPPRKWDIRARLEDFAASRAERLRERMRPPPDTGQLRVTVVPAPPRGGVALRELLEQDPEMGRRESGSEEGSVGESEGSGYEAPPMWPGVHPVYAESSRGSFVSWEEGEEERSTR